MHSSTVASNTKNSAKRGEIKLDTSKWLAPTGGAMTFSLGF